ncbi:MAG: polyprenyl synthetase family protein [Candidatus Omnitrophica bacterium]|nr:polyprenyl synthetase family protein [Candidatus Omnitrophota bacterium]
MIETYKKNIDKNLQAFLEKIKKEYKFHLVYPILFESIKDFCSRKGKRIRPLLMILSYQGYAKKRVSPKNLYTASSCLELLHNFMLIHDDIIDCSDLRRGKPTIHKILSKTVKTNDKEKLGQDLAIVAGDIVYALAIDAFLSINENHQRKEQALKYFIQTAAFTAMGEFIDIVHGFKKVSHIKEKDVFLNYSLKTARYTFECPLIIGAILAGAQKKEIKKLSRLGLLTGQAFQIQDDILGVFATQKNIGKSILSDIAEFKKTILVCHAYRELSGQKKKNFIKCFEKPKKTYSDLTAIRKIFIESGSLQYSLKKMNSLIEESKEILKKLRIKPEHKHYIETALFKLFEQSQHTMNTIPFET